jgi:hypothetical protein
MASVFDRIFADVRKDLPSVADAVLRQELFRVMDDFTQHTNIWQETLTVNILPDIASYVLPATTAGQINRLMFVYDVTQPVMSWPMGGIMMRVPGVMVLPRTLGNSATWGAIVAKRTSDVDATTLYPVVDDWIPDKYADTVGRGVLARLMVEPQKPYSNPMLAQANQKAYISGRSMARANDGHANVFNAQNWAYPQSFATVTRKPWT